MEKKKEDDDEVQFGPQVAQSGRIVPLSERQQMALLKKIEEQRKQSASPKPDNVQAKRLYNKLNKRNDRGETPLHRATIRGDENKVVELLNQGADVNCKDYANWTALHEACNHGYLDIVRALIEHGADVNVRGLDGDTPLHDAAVNGHEEITIVLIQSGGNPESENDKKETPIEVAEAEGTRRLLLEGIPIYKDFERRRKKERDRMREERDREREKNRKLFEETLDPIDEDEQHLSQQKSTSSGAGKSNNKRVGSSDFDSEDDLPISQLKKEEKTKSDEKLLDTSKSENMTINTEKKKKKDKQAEDEIEIEKKKKKAKKNKDTERKSSHRDKEEKPTVAAAAPPPQPPVTTITTAISPSSTKEDKEKQREVIWRLEIERKIRQEASEKGIELTSEQFQKVCERRMKKLTKKLAEKKHRRESTKPSSDSSPATPATATSTTTTTTASSEKPKTPIQSPVYETPLSPRSTTSNTPFSPKKDQSPKSSHQLKSPPSETSVTPVKKEKPVVLPKLDGLLTPKREKKESSDSLLSPNEDGGSDKSKKEAKKRKTDSTSANPSGSSSSSSSSDPVKKAKIKEHSFLMDTTIVPDHKKKLKEEKERKKKAQQQLEKEKKIRQELDHQKKIDSIKAERMRSASETSGSGGGAVTTGEKRDRRDSLIQGAQVSVTAQLAPEKKRVKTSESPVAQSKPPLSPARSPQLPVVTPTTMLLTTTSTTTTPVDTPKLFIPNVPPVTPNKTETKVDKPMSKIEPAQSTKTTTETTATATQAAVALVPASNDESKIKKKKSPFKPKRAWLTESAQAALDQRLNAEENNNLRIEPLTKTQLSDALKEICKIDGLEHARKELHESGLNDYDERFHIKQRLKGEWSKLKPIVPAAPEEYWNFSIFTGDYHLSTSLQDRLSFPKHAPSADLHVKLKSLFVGQEEQRWQILQRHTVQREKLRIAFEQEILRTYANAKRLEENQAKPYSACMILQAEFENQYELHAGDLPQSSTASTEGENNKRDRYSPRVLAAQLDDVRSKFGAKCKSMLRLQEMERDSTFQLQRMEWSQRAQAYDRDYRDSEGILDELVPAIAIEDFALF